MTLTTVEVPLPASAQSHPPQWHIRNGEFEGADAGLPVPQRAVSIRPKAPVRVSRRGGTVQTLIAALWIRRLDRSDPPGYTPGGVPRAVAFNRNVYRITAEPRMPVIEVECNAHGFDPARTPIMWRLQCRHVLCRYEKVVGKDSNGDAIRDRYDAVTQALDEEWQGRSTSRTFRLFDPGATSVHYDYNGVGRVMGGHAILTVAVRLPNGMLLQDHVHLRIAGTNPTLEQIRAYTESVVGDRDANIRQMIHALIWKEAGGKQFRDSRPGEREPAAQTHSFRTFHRGASNEHRVQFDYPDDPPDFPLVAFDFGVGILQFTRVAGQVVKPAMVWNWQENLRASFNIFFLKLGEAYAWLRANRPGFTWRDWAYQSWGRYNGSWSSSDPQSDYSDHIRDRWPGYSLISSARVPARASTHPDTRRLAGTDPLGAPPAWPPQLR